MKFTLPYPPSVNRYWRFPRALGRPILSAEARAYKANAGLEARVQGVTPLAGPVSVQINVFRPQRRGDLDNTAKVALDALNGIAWEDDEQIVHLELDRFDDKARPRLEVTIEQQGANDGQHPQG